MSIFDDFDANYGNEYYIAIPGVDGGTDIFHDGLVTEHVQPIDENTINTNFDKGNFIIKNANVDGGTDTFVNGKLVQHTQENVFVLGIPMRQMLSVQIQQDGIRYGLITEIGSVRKKNGQILQ